MIPITIHFTFLKSHWKKGLGVITTTWKSRQTNWGIVGFLTRWGIHTFLVNQSIDVVLVNQNQTIVAIRTIPPWHVWYWGIKEYLVLEMPAGQAANLGLTVQAPISYSYTA